MEKNNSGWVYGVSAILGILHQIVGYAMNKPESVTQGLVIFFSSLILAKLDKMREE